MKFVSRAGEKLEYALTSFDILVKDKIVADFGSSTGGFVDCLLQNGAKKVYAVDTSYGELAWKLRNDLRVVVLERTNAMHITLPEKVDLVTIDVSWTKQSKIVPNALKNLKKGGKIISLVKPQYEAPAYLLTHGRLIDSKIEEVIKKVEIDINNASAKVIKKCESPIVGAKGGNKEYLFFVAALRS